MKYNFFNKINVIIFVFITLVIGISFTMYMYPRFSKSEDLKFEKVEKNCKEDQDKKICHELGISNNETYERFMSYDSRVRRKELDQITLSSEIINNELFSFFGIVLPLIISIIVITTISNDIRSGFYQHILQRTKYRNYLFDKLKKILIISNIFPMFILLINFASGILTNFNMNIPEYYKTLAVYDNFKENYYLLSIILTYFATYFVCAIYGLIAFLCSLKEKSTIVCVVKSYLICIIVAFLDYYFLNIICNKIMNLQLDVLTFNILSYFQYNGRMNFAGVAINIIIILFALMFYGIRKYYKKEILYEQMAKQNSNI